MDVEALIEDGPQSAPVCAMKEQALDVASVPMPLAKLCLPECIACPEHAVLDTLKALDLPLPARQPVILYGLSRLTEN